ncbi:MAG: alpha/beta hydrolase [Oscillospiraceae bacterium]|nr:alpha/beta hydrolase [Oscillospiraceae bacterium]
MAVKILIYAVCIAAVLVLFYYGVGVALFSQMLSKKAASRGYNDLSDAHALLGKAGASIKVQQMSAWERFLMRIINKAAGVDGLDAFYDKPYYQSFFDGLKWFFDNTPKNITIDSPRGERLHAEMFLNEKKSDIWFICLHGFSSSPRDFGGAAKIYHDEWGCNVLLPYLCAHGKSESKYISMGWLDRIDIAAWIDYLVKEYDNPKIILHGVSMGAATTMMTTGEDLPPNVICAVADCGYTSVWDEYVEQAKVTFHVPPFPVLYALNTVAKKRLGFPLKEASCVEQLKKSKTPTLFIHGDADTFVPYWMLDKVYDACRAPKDKLTVQGADHAESGYEFDLYYGTIQKFIARYLPEIKAVEEV